MESMGMHVEKTPTFSGCPQNGLSQVAGYGLNKFFFMPSLTFY